MITVSKIYTAPVKSLALNQPERAYIGARGVDNDRRFYLINEQGKLLTQREQGRLVQIKADYQPETDWLRLTFPNGDTCAGHVVSGRGIGTIIWGRRVKGHLIEGDWNDALSQFCGKQVRLVASDDAGQAFDEFPVSLVSQASLDRLTEEASGQTIFEGARFRPSLLLAGCEPHQEDLWLGGVIQIGDDVRLQPVMPDPRCSIVTQDPITGERDADTLRLIMSYRPSPRNAYFGVYAIVVNPGTVAVGDEVRVIRASS